MPNDDTCRRLLTQANSLQLERAEFDQGFDRIRRVIWPSGGDFLGFQSPGQPVYTEILDATGEDECENAAAGMHSLLTNPAMRWFDLDLYDWQGIDTDAARLWLGAATDVLLKLFSHPLTHSYTATSTTYGEAVAFGNNCMFIEDRPSNLPLFRPIALADVWWDENDDGEPDCFYRRFRLSAWAAKKRWGDDLPERVLRCADNASEYHRRFEFWHCVEPRENGKYGAAGRRKPYASYWLCGEEPWLIREGGYEENPYIATRWKLRPGEVYGRGPGHKAYGPVSSLQRSLAATLAASEKAVDPPLFLPDDGVVGPLSLRAGALNWIRADYLRDGFGPRPINLGAQPQQGMQIDEGMRVMIRRLFLYELLAMIRDPRATATQVLEIKEQQQRSLAPIIVRMEQELLGPMVNRAFGIAQRAGLLPPPPPEIAGRTVRPNFTSPAMRAQRLSAARGIVQLFEIAAPMFQADPGTVDNIDLDEAVRDVADTVGVPAKVLRPVQKVLEMRKARQQVQEGREQREALKDVTTAGKNVAPLLQAVGGVQQQAAEAEAPEAMAA